MYAGYQYDKETGLYYLNARMYDPKVARFLQEDTYRGSISDPLSLNLYSYCANEPIMYFDPTGHAIAKLTAGHKKIYSADVENNVTTASFIELLQSINAGLRYEDGNYVVYFREKIDTEIYEPREVVFNESMFVEKNGDSHIGVRQFMDAVGYGETISYWYDTGGTLNVDVKPDMKYAPVKLIREKNNITVTAYIDFTGDANGIMLSTITNSFVGYTYAEIIASGIESKWSKDFYVEGQKLHLSTKIFSNNPSPNGVIKRDNNISDKQRFYKITVQDGFGDIHCSNWSSIYEPGEVLISARSPYRGEISYNQWDSSTYYLHNKESMQDSAGHEFGHVLGLADAYGNEEREIKPAPEWYFQSDGTAYRISEDDMMRGGKYEVSNFDVKLLLKAWEENKKQFFPQHELDIYEFVGGSSVTEGAK